MAPKVHSYGDMAANCGELVVKSLDGHAEKPNGVGICGASASGISQPGMAFGYRYRHHF